MSSLVVIAGYGFREALRRKVFAVVLVLTVGVPRSSSGSRTTSSSPTWRASSRPQDVNVDTRTFAGSFLTGLAMFATLFLGVVLAVFLTLGVVTGDAERGLLQPLVVQAGRTLDAAPLALRRRVAGLRRIRARGLLPRRLHRRADRALLARRARLARASSSPAAS